jgi:hypothetical protein
MRCNCCNEVGFIEDQKTLDFYCKVCYDEIQRCISGYPKIPKKENINLEYALAKRDFKYGVGSDGGEV